MSIALGQTNGLLKSGAGSCGLELKVSSFQFWEMKENRQDKWD
tara:strand:+ start:403 stop:531 length:129 start_codon:yes stop_codon:yes gene_type:complete